MSKRSSSVLEYQTAPDVGDVGPRFRKYVCSRWSSRSVPITSPVHESPLIVLQPHRRAFRSVTLKVWFFHRLPRGVRTPARCQSRTMEFTEAPASRRRTALRSSSLSTGSRVTLSSRQPNGRCPFFGVPSMARALFHWRARRRIFLISTRASSQVEATARPRLRDASPGLDPRPRGAVRAGRPRPRPAVDGSDHAQTPAP